MSAQYSCFLPDTTNVMFCFRIIIVYILYLCKQTNIACGPECRDCERQPTFTGPKKTFCSLSIVIFFKFGTDSVFSIFKVYLPITCTDKWRFQRVMSTLRFVDVLFDTTRESCTTRWKNTTRTNHFWQEL